MYLILSVIMTALCKLVS